MGQSEIFHVVFHFIKKKSDLVTGGKASNSKGVFAIMLPPPCFDIYLLGSILVTPCNSNWIVWYMNILEQDEVLCNEVKNIPHTNTGNNAKYHTSEYSKHNSLWICFRRESFITIFFFHKFYRSLHKNSVVRRPHPVNIGVGSVKFVNWKVRWDCRYFKSHVSKTISCSQLCVLNRVSLMKLSKTLCNGLNIICWESTIIKPWILCYVPGCILID